MEKFVTLTAIAAPLAEPNLDTNQLCPTRFNKVPRNAPEYPRILLHDRRFDADGNERPEFLLNRPPWREAKIIIADCNFGCGSSRESAVYALAAFGIRAVIASSFGDIFRSNCLKNGLLPIQLPDEAVTELRDAVTASQGGHVAIDLPAQTVTGPDDRSWPFDIHPLHKRCLVEGLDDFALTDRYADEFGAFEVRYRAEAPWLFDSG
jgi:3-isopropylmalate/(R)-2-methylmalate dehydratase small subunit